eukprot:TRINITY_DN9621_c0_g1_i1.p3 TRINITY_DN9621_c0_g1~~TRINITY_DN9621_c0_g1_i1.p3  ORF type:complete len:244 (-),score=2.39 TRINITY_DN9621_c0_g1_i1:718-1449(-)
MIRRPPRSTHCISSAASDVYKRQFLTFACTIQSPLHHELPANSFCVFAGQDFPGIDDHFGSHQIKLSTKFSELGPFRHSQTCVCIFQCVGCALEIIDRRIDFAHGGIGFGIICLDQCTSCYQLGNDRNGSGLSGIIGIILKGQSQYCNLFSCQVSHPFFQKLNDPHRLALIHLDHRLEQYGIFARIFCEMDQSGHIFWKAASPKTCPCIEEMGRYSVVHAHSFHNLINVDAKPLAHISQFIGK